MFDNLMCMMNRHRPAERRADWDGETFVSKCGNCRKPIRRFGKGRWLLDEEGRIDS